MSLVKHLKNNGLKTNVGNFEYVDQIGQGGNAFVYKFKKNKNYYAIKFIEHRKNIKHINRFIDEYFCTAQIGSHENIVQSYHFENIFINDTKYSINIMKKYTNSLKAMDKINHLSDEEKLIKGKKLANSLLKGLGFLHKNKIVHRDIKPENIFYDESVDEFVIGDMGIAHFSDELAKQSYTREGERLSNYLCSPLEQVQSTSEPHPNWDLYAMGQVINWYVFGDFIRGDGKDLYKGNNEDLKILDDIITKCVQNSPDKRFSSVDNILEFITKSKTIKRDVFARLHDFDMVIRSSVPNMKDVFYETTDKVEIERFLNNFSNDCLLKEFWYITDTAGDNPLNQFEKINKNKWLLANCFEIKVEKIIFFKNSGLYKSLFIIFTEKENEFEVIGADGHKINRDLPASWNRDVASFYRGNYYEGNYFDNGYIEIDGDVKKIDFKEVSYRERYLRPSSFMIVPYRTGPSFCDRQYNEDILQIATNNRTVTEQELIKFVELANKKLDPEISKWR